MALVRTSRIARGARRPALGVLAVLVVLCPAAVDARAQSGGLTVAVGAVTGPPAGPLQVVVAVSGESTTGGLLTAAAPALGVCPEDPDGLEAEDLISAATVTPGTFTRELRLTADGGRREFCAWLSGPAGVREATGLATASLPPTLGEPLGPESLQRTSPGIAVRIDWSEPDDATAAPTYRPFEGGFSLRAVTSEGAERDLAIRSPYGGGLSGAEPLRLVDLDGDGEREAIVKWYSGGAHCCVNAVILDPFAGGALIDVIRANFADAGYSLRDLRGPGLEIVTGDARFAYVLSSYAASRFPVRILRLTGGRLRDVTAGYPRILQRDQRRQLADYRSIARSSGPREARSALAAFIADGIRLRRTGAAWAVARRELARTGDPGGARAIRRVLTRLGY